MNMLNEYIRFYSATTTVSAGFGGLLFIALSVVNLDDLQPITRERRNVLPASAFLALVDVFFVSLVNSLGSAQVLASTGTLMGLAGLLGTSRLPPRASRAGAFASDSAKRRSSLTFAAIAYGIFSIQVIVSLALLLNSHNAVMTRAMAFVIVALFVSALSRAWEVAGIARRSAAAHR